MTKKLRDFISKRRHTGESDAPHLFELSAIPARALYHAANAAKRPKAPPATMQPCCGCTPSFCRYPMPSIRNAMSSVKNRKKKATVERRVQMTKIVVKMNQPIRYRPNEFRKFDSLTSASVLSIAKPPGVRMMANDSQKPPYEESAVAPKVFPTAISL